MHRIRQLHIFFTYNIHYIFCIVYIFWMWMLGWHVRSRPLVLWCSQIVAPYVCWQVCVPSRLPALWCSQIVVPYMCAGRRVCSPGCRCCKICCWCHHTSPPYIDCLVMMPHGTIANSPSWATGLTGMWEWGVLRTSHEWIQCCSILVYSRLQIKT